MDSFKRFMEHMTRTKPDWRGLTSVNLASIPIFTSDIAEYVHGIIQGASKLEKLDLSRTISKLPVTLD